MESSEEKTNRIWNRQDERWLFSRTHLEKSTPSRLVGLNQAYEEQTLQVLCNFLQDMGQRLGVTQLCINTACVYLRRLYVMTDLKRFNKHLASAMCLFLAAKVEEQPRKLEHLIQTKIKLVGSHVKVNYNTSIGDQKSREAQEVAAVAEEGKLMENSILKFLGFDLQINHPHTYVVRGCQMLKASKDFAQTAYFLATNSLHLTNMCVMYKSSAVACVCIHLAAKWARYQIPQSIEGKDWYNYIAIDLDKPTLLRMASELMTTFEKCPDNLKRTFRTANVGRMDRALPSAESAEAEKKRRRTEAAATVTSASEPVPGPSGAPSHRSQQQPAEAGSRQHHPQAQHHRSSSGSHPVQPIAAKPAYHRDGRPQSGHLIKDPLAIPPAAVGRVPSAAPPAAASRPSSAAGYAGTPPVNPTSRQEAPPPRPVAMETQDRHAMHHSRSQPNLSAAEAAKKSQQKLSLKDYHQRIEARPAPAPQQQQAPAVKSEHPHHNPSHAHNNPHHPQFQQQQGQAPRGGGGEGRGSDPKMAGRGVERVNSVSSEAVHLKEAKVLVQDLKDSHGQDRLLYANAEASRKRSISQSSREDDGELIHVGGPPAKQSRSSHHHHQQQQQLQQQQQRGKGQPSSRHSSGRPMPGGADPSSDKVMPLKLHIKRDAGTLQVKHPGQDPASSSSSSSSSSPSLRMKIRVNPETSGMQHEVPTQADGLKLRLQVPSPGGRSSSGQEKHSQQQQHHPYSNGGHGGERKHKHSSRSHTQLQTGGGDKSLHRSASASQVTATQPQQQPHHDLGIMFGSATQPFQGQRKSSSQSSRPPLKTQHSGFSFPDHFVSANLPDMIFEPDTPTEMNGGSFEAPPTPTAENMSRIKAQMQQMYAQTKTHHQQAPPSSQYPPMHHPHHQPQMYNMYRSQQPPLPPPLPDIPPPQPPPPPQ